MKIILSNITGNTANLLRRSGYVFQHRDGEEMSFVRVIGKSGYPRFHIYAKTDGKNLILNLHLDQKRETYGQATRHHGEYEDSKVVENEAARIRQAIT